MINLKKTSTIKFWCSIFFFADAVVWIGICDCFLPSKAFSQYVIEEYNNGSIMAEDICKFVDIPKVGEPIQKAINPLKKYKYVIFFDCDGVLQRNTDPTLVGPRIWNFMKGEGADTCKTIIWDSPKNTVEDSILALIQHLKKCDIPHFVVTQCTSDPQTQSMRETILNELGYSFENNILENDEKVQDKYDKKDFWQLSPKQGQTTITPPRFANGIVYAGSATKEATFEWLFDLIQSSEKFCDISDVKFVFIDDKVSNLEEFCKVCNKHGVKQYRACHYTSDQQQANSVPQTEQPVAKLQKRIVRTGRFLSCDDARFLTKAFRSLSI